MKITIEIEASSEMTPEVLKSIGAALGWKPATEEVPVVELTKVSEITKTTKTKKSEATKDEKKSEPEVTYTLEEVRSKLADLSRAGKQAQVKALLGEFGANKLSEVKEEDYAALMKKAEEL